MRFLVGPLLILVLTTYSARAADKPSVDKSPSPIQIQKTLEGIVKILEERDPKSSFDLLPILSLTTKALSIELKEDEIRQAQKDWGVFLQEQGDALRLDSLERQARRILIWELQWLYRRGLKNP